MRQWRVGTVSMGIALIVFGTSMFLSQARGMDAFETLLRWWPLIFILLGLELLLWIGVSRMAQPIVKYDVFSIFFVGILCVIGLGGAILTSTGLMQELRYAVQSQMELVEMEDIAVQLPESIDRIVVLNRSVWNVSVDKTAEQSIHIFGTYDKVAYTGDESTKDPNSFVKMNTVGNTIYVEVNGQSYRRSLRNDTPQLRLTVVLPDRVKTEIIGQYDSL